MSTTDDYDPELQRFFHQVIQASGPILERDLVAAGKQFFEMLCLAAVIEAWREHRIEMKWDHETKKLLYPTTPFGHVLAGTDL